MSSSFARSLTRASDGETLPLHCRITSVTSIFNFSARATNVRNCLAQAAPMCVWRTYRVVCIYLASSSAERRP